MRAGPLLRRMLVPVIAMAVIRSVALAGNNSGIISTGDGAKNTLHQ